MSKIYFLSSIQEIDLVLDDIDFSIIFYEETSKGGYELKHSSSRGGDTDGNGCDDETYLPPKKASKPRKMKNSTVSIREALDRMDSRDDNFNHKRKQFYTYLEKFLGRAPCN